MEASVFPFLRLFAQCLVVELEGFVHPIEEAVPPRGIWEAPLGITELRRVRPFAVRVQELVVQQVLDCLLRDFVRRQQAVDLDEEAVAGERRATAEPALDDVAAPAHIENFRLAELRETVIDVSQKFFEVVSIRLDMIFPAVFNIHQMRVLLTCKEVFDRAPERYERSVNGFHALGAFILRMQPIDLFVCELVRDVLVLLEQVLHDALRARRIFFSQVKIRWSDLML